MTIDYDTVARLAQEYVAHVPVTVLGSGASIPHGLPGMTELATHLGTNLHSTSSQDNEQLAAFRQHLDTKKNLETALHEVELSSGLVRQIVHLTWELLTEKDLVCFRHAFIDRKFLPLTRLFEYLLRTANPEITIVTTNYDRLAEYAVDLADAPAFTGFSVGYRQKFLAYDSRDSFPKYPKAKGKVYIWKVHGSLDWFIGPDGEPVAAPLSSSIPPSCSPLIVTPGISKYREAHREPYRTVMGCSDAALSQAPSYLCIGYGFNDEHVQPKLENRVLATSTPLIVITKELSPSCRKLIANERCQRYLALSEHPQGTLVHSHTTPSGAVLQNRAVWQVPEFINMVIGE